MNKEACYGPMGKAAWDAVESKIDALCGDLTELEKYGASFKVNWETGEVTRAWPPRKPHPASASQEPK